MPEAVAEELCVKFRNIDEIQGFAKAVNQFDGDVDLKQGRITVSYTHLDVYKRQSRKRAVTCHRGRSSFCVLPELCSEFRIC